MKISLIISVFNKAPFLERCLDSIVGQYEKPSQVILIDDGSSDGSDKICDDFATKFGWEVYHQANKGVSAARNLGIDKATGDYITFLDADDVLMPDAIASMKNAAGLDYNIVQFRQYRCRNIDELVSVPYGANSGYYDFAFIPKYWVMVWNKIYKRSFLLKNRLRFIEGMQFGEDAVFNAECILKNGSLYHSNQVTIIHCLDDKKSLCRGHLNLERVKRLDAELVRIEHEQKDPTKRRWVEKAIEEHRNSKLFKKYGFEEERSGKYDIVYFVKDSPVNEELRYSLRSVEQNWSYKNVWFCGGCPDSLKPDKYFRVQQEGVDKWNKVRNMIRRVCENDEITEDFWLFNDDFFVLKQLAGISAPPTYNGELIPYIERIERKNGEPDDYTIRLREAANTLKRAGKTTLNYEVHKPMLINRKKALEVLDKFPATPAFRSLYGNYFGIGGIDRHDMKLKVLKYGKMQMVVDYWDFVSTNDTSFQYGEIGEFIRAKFNKPSRFER